MSQANRPPVSLMEGYQRVNQRCANRVLTSSIRSIEREFLGNDHTWHALHQIERCSDYTSICAGLQDARYRHAGGIQSAQNAIFTQNIMGCEQKGTSRRTPQYPLLTTPPDEECLIGMSTTDMLNLKWSVLARKMVRQVLAQVIFDE